LVQEKVIAHRDLTAKEVIEQAIGDINKLLEGISLKTVLVDINSEQPVFKSFCGPLILSNELSGGEKQLYYKAILFDKLRPQNSLIMVDEPETSLHPTWQQEVLKLYNNIPGNNQVILVTHSPHIIASIQPDNLFVLNMNEEKKTVECFNARDKGFHTRGNEPNDILDEVMGTPLRDWDTRKRINEVIELLRSQPDKIDEPKNKTLIESLMSDLGPSDPIIMRIIHKLSIIQAGK
jgi:ABC-type methionine transport system ATPase subunit